MRSQRICMVAQVVLAELTGIGDAEQLTCDSNCGPKARGLMSWGDRKFNVGRKLYRTQRWQMMRVKVLREQPLCVLKGKREHCRLVATEVDHITPHRGDRKLFFDRQNLQPMCRTATRKRLRGRFLARDQVPTSTACRSIPITTGTRKTEQPLERGHPDYSHVSEVRPTLRIFA